MINCFLITSCIFFAMSAFASDDKTPKESAFTLPGGAELEMVWIEAGDFTMGSPDTENGRESNEIHHKVTISKGFWIGKYEITQSQWQDAMNTQPWEGQIFVKKDGNYPVVYISWNDTQNFIKKLNKAESKEIYRLPTEAEWEYACRAGTESAYCFGDDVNKLDDYGWHGKNTYDLGNYYAHKVGQKLPNPWGIYDMHGNVWEWVQDFYGDYPKELLIDPKGPELDDNHIFRGGSFYYLSRFARSSYRGYNTPNHRLFNLGFRIVRQED